MKTIPQVMRLAALGFLLIACVGAAEPITKATPEQLAGWLRQYPQADANGDGTLTVAEADACRQKLEKEPRAGARIAPVRSRSEFAFATMSDGVKIALAIGYPKDFVPSDTRRKWPAIYVSCGYALATWPGDPGDYDHRYVTVTASLRGTGASGGALSPWRPRTWQDGYEVIENWIVQQPWSNGKVGIRGHSWTGLMGFLTASTCPPSLKAVCVSGLIDDFYRDIARPGGVRNFGFPVMWMNNDYRLDGPFGSGVAAQKARGLDAAAYDAIVASRPPRDLTEDQLWLMLHEPFDGPRWQQRSLGAQASKIRAPMLIGHTWQDEQTGPSGWMLWKRLPVGTPKRLVLSNGDHSVYSLSRDEKLAWFDHYLLDQTDASIASGEPRVKCYFETAGAKEGRASVGGPFLAAGDFPLPDTRWTRLYLRAGNRLSTAAADADEKPDSYLVTFQNVRAPAERFTYQLEFTEPTAICGPAVLTLWAKLTNLDTDFFILLSDVGPDGKSYGLQRGLLRASHRSLDPQYSDYANVGGRKVLIRPQHPHTRPEPVTPHVACEFQIEIPTLGHVFRPGHKLAMTITRPPLADPIGVTKSGGPSYQYDSYPPAGTVTILHDAAHPSSLLLPVLPKLPPTSLGPVPLSQQAGLQPVK
ncbi:MAG: CocE/NonD family hydrolase [Verrucomicrobiia bacterium]